MRCLWLQHGLAILLGRSSHKAEQGAAEWVAEVPLVVYFYWRKVLLGLPIARQIVNLKCRKDAAILMTQGQISLRNRLLCNFFWTESDLILERLLDRQ